MQTAVTMLAPSAPFLWGAAGFCLGASVLGAAWAVLDGRRRYVRRLVLGFAARALVDALTDLEQDGELGYHHMHRVGDIRDLAAAVAKVAQE